jgi:hypothetical protein
MAEKTAKKTVKTVLGRFADVGEIVRTGQSGWDRRVPGDCVGCGEKEPETSDGLCAVCAEELLDTVYCNEADWDVVTDCAIEEGELKVVNERDMLKFTNWLQLTKVGMQGR